MDFGFFIFWLITGLAIWTGILSFYLQWQTTCLSWAQELELLVSVFRWAPFSLLNRFKDYSPVFSKPDWRQMWSLNFNHQKFFSFGSMCGGRKRSCLVMAQRWVPIVPEAQMASGKWAVGWVFPAFRLGRVWHLKPDSFR